jgi:D-glycero-D-manno-heptose 1,7-bisphosphate phosphatase
MACAAAGLALRGHAMAWRGPVPAGVPVERIDGLPALWRTRADLVLTDDPRPAGAVLAAWFAHAPALVAALTHGAVARWSPLDRAAWHSLHALGLVAPEESERFQERPGGLDLARLGMWPGAPAAASPDPAHADTEVLERACERALARATAGVHRAALFVDRDGTLVREVGYLDDPERLELLPGVAAALREARAAGHPVVVVSNQAGVGRGYFPLSRAYETMAALRRRLRSAGVELDAIHLCPHAPDEHCACRKPATLLLRRAADDLRLDLTRSMMAGDKRIDSATAQAAGGTGVLVRSGYGREEEGNAAAGPAPDRVFDDLAGAVAWFLARETPGA